MVDKVCNLPVKDVEADEIWGYVGVKEGHKKERHGHELGDAYCFIGMERNTKLVLAWHLGKRTAKSTDDFIGKLAYSTSSDGRFQLTTDGFPPYGKRDVLAVLTVDADLRDRAACVHDPFKWTRPVARSV
jgi:IS1 family transposase